MQNVLIDLADLAMAIDKQGASIAIEAPLPMDYQYECSEKTQRLAMHQAIRNSVKARDTMPKPINLISADMGKTDRRLPGIGHT
ncbi:hypothetical protein VB780_19715 [Leptolyngbya sp. CCNP1308]|uniref:hypothetical protein n=1 Tax=Leptolyngbya sp. CCNP1308 TaxID=3110255 RepID=UPI002B211334|nr:hypothetical protein [Leptolyngbya sp. CCNP1308]MEA5450818.1 hypothetical protein [Leptolyngbya sp. CCNP1308]